MEPHTPAQEISGKQWQWSNLLPPVSKPTKACEWRWMEELQDYHFGIVQRLGRLDVKAGQLSCRQHLPDKTEHVKGVAGQKSPQVLACVAFNRDCSKQVGKWVKSNTKPSLEFVREQPEEVHRYVRVLAQLKIIRGALYLLAPETDQPHKTGDKPRVQLLVPPSCREDTFAWVHFHPISSHLGTAATVERILQYF